MTAPTVSTVDGPADEVRASLLSLGMVSTIVADTLTAHDARGVPGSAGACPIAAYLHRLYPEAGTVLVYYQPHPWGVEAFLPFGAGPRVCIGAGFALAEAQIILASLLARFEIGLKGQRPVIPVASITLGPDHEPDFTLTPISQARP